MYDCTTVPIEPEVRVPGRLQQTTLMSWRLAGSKHLKQGGSRPEYMHPAVPWTGGFSRGTYPVDAPATSSNHSAPNMELLDHVTCLEKQRQRTRIQELASSK